MNKKLLVNKLRFSKKINKTFKGLNGDDKTKIAVYTNIEFGYNVAEILAHIYKQNEILSI